MIYPPNYTDKDIHKTIRKWTKKKQRGSSAEQLLERGWKLIAEGKKKK